MAVKVKRSPTTIHRRTSRKFSAALRSGGGETDYQTDVFECEFAFNADPTWGLAFWGDPTWDTENPLMLDIQASLDGGTTFTSLILGRADRVTAYLDKGLIRVEGRDLASLLIDASASMSDYQNRTASQIATDLAASHGLSADVTATDVLVGRMYEIDHTFAAPTGTTKQWDLICSLAQYEGFDVWVSQQTLHFHPQPNPGAADPYVVVWDGGAAFSNASTLSAERALTFAKDISVTVSSWHSKQGRANTATVGQKNAAVGNRFSYIFPNLDNAGCLDKATQIRAQLSAHERLVRFSRPADLALSARDMLRLSGTGSSWDQLYKIDSLHRTMSFDGGFTMDVQAKTPLPQTSS